MLQLIQSLSSLVIVVITIGITQVIKLPTTPVGLHQTKPSQSTTHVHQVGVFLTEVVMVYGQRQDLLVLNTIVQIREYLSVYHLLQKLGILLRVIATITMAVSSMSVTTATVGRPLLAATARTPCTSTMAASFRRSATLARTATQSAVSKNQNNLD